VLQVWREADGIAQIEHAWLFDHLMPIGGDPHGPAFEGWTLLSALAALTERLWLGVTVTSNRFRPPAMPAKIAATVDLVSGGRPVEHAWGEHRAGDCPQRRAGSGTRRDGSQSGRNLPIHRPARLLESAPGHPSPHPRGD